MEGMIHSWFFQYSSYWTLHLGHYNMLMEGKDIAQGRKKKKLESGGSVCYRLEDSPNIYILHYVSLPALFMPAKSLGHLCLRLHNTVDCRPQGRAPLSLGFSRQEYWSELPCPPPADLPDPGIEPASLMSPALRADSLPLAPPRKPAYTIIRLYDEFWSVALGRLWHRSPPDYVTCNQLWIISSLPLPVLESLEALCWDRATSRSWKNPWSIAGKWAALESISTCRGFVRRDNKFFV